MTRFLRFEIGGASALIWMLAFLSPYLNMNELLQIDSTKLLSVVLGSAVLSIPVGNYVHQIADTLFNPFREWRLLFSRRMVIGEIQKALGKRAKSFHDNTYQAVLVFSKICAYEHRSRGNRTDKFNSDLMREEISNRYSYYYARLENGLVAPLTGWIVAKFLLVLFHDTVILIAQPRFPLWYVYLSAVAVAALTLWRIPKLFAELDDLEVTLVRVQRAVWRRLVA